MGNMDQDGESRRTRRVVLLYLTEKKLWRESFGLPGNLGKGDPFGTEEGSVQKGKKGFFVCPTSGCLFERGSLKWNMPGIYGVMNIYMGFLGEK